MGCTIKVDPGEMSFTASVLQSTAMELTGIGSEVQSQCCSCCLPAEIEGEVMAAASAVEAVLALVAEDLSLQATDLSSRGVVAANDSLATASSSFAPSSSSAPVAGSGVVAGLPASTTTGFVGGGDSLIAGSAVAGFVGGGDSLIAGGIAGGSTMGVIGGSANLAMTIVPGTAGTPVFSSPYFGSVYNDHQGDGLPNFNSNWLVPSLSDVRGQGIREGKSWMAGMGLDTYGGLPGYGLAGGFDGFVGR